MMGPEVKRLVSILAVVLLAAACDRGARAGSNGPTTQTIAPAPAQPAPTGTEALTQTTEVEDSRSEGEGGGEVAPVTTAAPAKKAPVKKQKAESRKQK